jgi:transcriptional regulator
MYLPRHFEEGRLEVLHALVAAHPLGTLVRVGDDGLDADHLPFELAPPTETAPRGLLRAHVARANPLWRGDGAPVLVVFQGASGYVSPNLYDKEAAGGRVVPTWNYAVVHVHGRLRTIDDPAWTLALMERLTARHEGPEGWAVADAPREYIEKMVAATVGIEIAVERIEGKWKASQNRSAAERERVAAATGLAPPP